VEIGPVISKTNDDQDLARVGQQLHNSLLEGLAPRGAQGEQIYRLDVRLSEGISSLAVRKSAVATRADLRLNANFWLSDLRSGQNLYSGSGSATASFNILNSEFATLMAENGARDRAVRQLGDDILQNVAIFLKNQTGAR
jgi:LPS-assembly lipoprotein